MINVAMYPVDVLKGLSGLWTVSCCCFSMYIVYVVFSCMIIDSHFSLKSAECRENFHKLEKFLLLYVVLVWLCIAIKTCSPSKYNWCSERNMAITVGLPIIVRYSIVADYDFVRVECCVPLMVVVVIGDLLSSGL